MAQTWLDFITDALQEIGVYAPGDTIEPSVLDTCVRRLNYLIDEWAALKRYAFNVSFTTYTITPNHQPTLIGPNLTSPDWATVGGATRPVRIEGANLVLNSNNPSTDLIINVRDDAWWLGQQVKALTSTIPTDLYYSPDFPNGAIYLWPIPTVAYQVRLEVWVAVGQVDPDTIQNTNVVIPQGYKKAMLLTFAEDLTTPLSRAMPDTLPIRAARARAAVQSNNISSPRIASADFGTGLGRHRSGFNWESGMPS